MCFKRDLYISEQSVSILKFKISENVTVSSAANLHHERLRCSFVGFLSSDFTCYKIKYSGPTIVILRLGGQFLVDKMSSGIWVNRR